MIQHVYMDYQQIPVPQESQKLEFILRLVWITWNVDGIQKNLNYENRFPQSSNPSSVTKFKRSVNLDSLSYFVFTSKFTQRWWKCVHRFQSAFRFIRGGLENAILRSTNELVSSGVHVCASWFHRRSANRFDSDLKSLLIVFIIFICSTSSSTHLLANKHLSRLNRTHPPLNWICT